MNEDELKHRLSELEVPGENEAEERGWQTVRAAFGEREPEPTPNRSGMRRRSAGGLLAAVLALVAAAVLVITPAGASVRDWVGDVFDGRDLESSTVVSSIPGGGSLLVDSPQGTWVTRSGNSNRLLGDFSDPAWSPRGLFVAAIDDNNLVALEPGGDVRWSLTRPGELSMPTWKSPDGYRIAYLEDDQLRVVAGDGTGDTLIARGLARVQPAWRPGPTNTLAYIRRDGRIELVQTDTGERRAVTTSSSAPTSLQWSTDGTRLLTWSRDGAELLDPDGSIRWRYRPPRGILIDTAALRPGKSRQVAVLEGDGRTTVVLAGPGRARQVLLAAPSDLEDPVWSPDGAWLNLGWPEADQWLFLHGRRLGRVDVVTDVAEQFSPGVDRPLTFPQVRDWCCTG